MVIQNMEKMKVSDKDFSIVKVNFRSQGQMQQNPITELHQEIMKNLMSLKVLAVSKKLNTSDSRTVLTTMRAGVSGNDFWELGNGNG